MDDLARQTRYWATAGATKTFTHPLDAGWLAGVNRSARVLDYGCGYGRTMAELCDLGFTDVSGVDISPALVARGRQTRPDLSFAVIESPPTLTQPAASFDVIILFAVLTCIPEDDAQRALIAEVSRLLVSGGLLYVSDLRLQTDERNRRRYAEYAERYGDPYGAFTTDDGAVCRHHHVEHLRTIMSEFDLLRESHIDVSTMNGRPASAVQLLVRTR
jgi:SAM-dependent methyltransferase